jgi:hypothetical protein
LTDPIFEYGHDLGCSVTGGLVYRGKVLEQLYGVYLFGDYCSGRIWGMVRNADGEWQTGLLFSTSANISSFGEDEQGEMYLLDHVGRVYRLIQR